MGGRVSDLRRLWNKAVTGSVYNDGRRAVVGKADGTVFFVDDSGVEYRDRIWIRYVDTDTPSGEAVVSRGGVPDTVGTAVRIQNRNGQLTAVLDRYSGVAQAFSNGGTINVIESHDHMRLGTNPQYIEGLAFLPLAVLPSTPLALTVYVFPGWYRYFDPQPIPWGGGTSGSLSSYVPGSDDGTKHFVIIAIDRRDNTIAIIDGDDVAAGGNPLFPIEAVVTVTDIEAITIAAYYLPLAAVTLTYGQTQIRPKDITHDLRLWGMEIPQETGKVQLLFTQIVDGTAANTTDPTDLFSTGVGSVTIPANTFEVGTVVRLYLTGHVSTTGSPTIEFSVDLGGSELGSTGANTIGPGLSNTGWRAWIDIVCRGFPVTGSFVVSGLVRLGADLFGIVNTSTTTLDPTDPLQLEFFAAWGTADVSNTVTCQTATVELLPITGL